MQYYLNDTRICKAVFCSALCIHTKRVNYLMTHKNKSELFVVDRRGRKPPSNKLPDIIVDKVNDFLKEFHKSKRTYGGDSTKSFFANEITNKKLHELFTESNPDLKCSLTSFMKILKNTRK